MALTQISTAGVKDDAVTSAKIPADAIGSSEIAANAVGSSELADNAVDNAAVASNAAIAGTKISPNFGSQNIQTTGGISNAQFLNLSATSPSIDFTDTNNNSDFMLQNANGVFKLFDSTNSADRWAVASDGTFDINGNLDANAGIDVTGNITGTGDMTIDTNTLHVDSSNNRVGVGGTSPAEKLDVIGNIKFGANSQGLIQEDGVKLVFKANAAAREAHIMTHDGNEDINLDPSGFIQFETAGSERMRIDSSGNVGINTTSSHGKLQVHDGSIVHSKPAGGGTRNWKFVNNNTAVGDYGIQISTTEEGSTYVNHTELKAGGNVHIHDGNLVVASGHGIDFSADGNASGNTSELLHDYEEGSWSANSLNYDYDGNQAQRGHYVKIGRMVFATFRLKFHNQTTHVGNHLRFTGLPFTSANGNPYDVGVSGTAHGYGEIATFRIYVQPGSTYAYWYTDSGSVFNNSTALNNKDIRGTIIYTASS